MELRRLSFRSRAPAYQQQADDLLHSYQAGDKRASEFFRTQHPGFRHPQIPWLARAAPLDQVRSAGFGPADAQLAIARWYDFFDWAALEAWADAVTVKGSVVEQFESAVEAVIHGETATLQPLLHANPDLVRARSTRLTPFDPPLHRATLLHYIADHATLPMLVSSCHPARAKLQVPLIHTLVDYGASLEAIGEGDSACPLLTALAFGYHDAAAALVERGASIRSLPIAAGLNRLEQANELLPAATGDERHRALALAAQNGATRIVRLLLDAGEDPNRYNPKHNHGHSTPLHQAVWSGNMDVVRLLVERGARLDIEDTIWHGNPLAWAEHGERTEIAEYLRSQQSVRSDSL